MKERELESAAAGDATGGPPTTRRANARAWMGVRSGRPCGGYLTLIIFLFSIGATHAATSSTFEQAATDYQAGRFAQARDNYLSLLDERRGDANLYYNLANTYYRLNDLGRAILWYERALAIKPYDPDIRLNLTMAKSGLQGAEENAVEKLLRFPRAAWLLWTSTLFLWGWTGILGASLLKPAWGSKKTSKGMVFCFALWIVSSGWGLWRLWDDSRPWAIVVSPTVQVRSGPAPEFTVGATVPPGLRVLLLEEQGGWDLIGMPTAGIKGWVQKGDVEKILP